MAILAEKYAVDYSWYVDTILNLIRIAGDYVSEEVWYRVLQIVTNRDDVQGYAAKTVFEVSSLHFDSIMELSCQSYAPPAGLASCSVPALSELPKGHGSCSFGSSPACSVHSICVKSLQESWSLHSSPCSAAQAQRVSVSRDSACMAAGMNVWPGLGSGYGRECLLCKYESLVFIPRLKQKLSKCAQVCVHGDEGCVTPAL